MPDERRRPWRRPRSASGQATVELVLSLPLLVLVLLAVIQVALVAQAQLAVVHATREATRAAAVEGTAEAARRGALRSGLAPSRVEVDADIDRREGGLARVEVRYRCPTDVPIIGRLVADPVLDAELVMRVEQPADQSDWSAPSGPGP